jgi:hypothetical protein
MLVSSYDQVVLSKDEKRRRETIENIEDERLVRAALTPERSRKRLLSMSNSLFSGLSMLQHVQ